MEVEPVTYERVLRTGLFLRTCAGVGRLLSSWKLGRLQEGEQVGQGGGFRSHLFSLFGPQ